MDKAIAKHYVLKGLNSIKITKSTCWGFLFFNLILLGISIALLQEGIFIIMVGVVAAIHISVVIFFSIIKWSSFFIFLVQAILFVFFVLTLNFLSFSLEKFAGLFVWYDFLISIILQVVAFATSALIVKWIVKRASGHYGNIPALASSVAVCFYGIGTILCKIFLTDVSLSIVITIVNILLNIMVYITSYVIVSGFYRAFLTVKYHLSLNYPGNQEKEMM